MNTVALADMTKDELLAYAKEHDVAANASMSKADIQAAIEEDEDAETDPADDDDETPAEDVPPGSPVEPAPDAASGGSYPTLEDKSKDELLVYAGEQGIDVGDASTKEDLLNTIQSAELEARAGAPIQPEMSLEEKVDYLAKRLGIDLENPV